ncbi:hypothetical protein VP01_867g2 [Puccinia sorghi]|uniref:Uncharacterized protein n=1 Tax=Puccinia sorghi TaxID=27349 RepID=A0A0L6U8R2_9BASI|nr:hypothetical protein VP01_867g2 [Puccinia sorghi]
MLTVFSHHSTFLPLHVAFFPPPPRFPNCTLTFEISNLTSDTTSLPFNHHPIFCFPGNQRSFLDTTRRIENLFVLRTYQGNIVFQVLVPYLYACLESLLSYVVAISFVLLLNGSHDVPDVDIGSRPTNQCDLRVSGKHSLLRPCQARDFLLSSLILIIYRYIYMYIIDPRGVVVLNPSTDMGGNIPPMHIAGVAQPNMCQPTTHLCWNSGLIPLCLSCSQNHDSISHTIFSHISITLLFNIIFLHSILKSEPDLLVLSGIDTSNLTLTVYSLLFLCVELKLIILEFYQPHSPTQTKHPPTKTPATYHTPNPKMFPEVPSPPTQSFLEPFLHQLTQETLEQKQKIQEQEESISQKEDSTSPESPANHKSPLERDQTAESLPDINSKQNNNNTEEKSAQQTEEKKHHQQSQSKLL